MESRRLLRQGVNYVRKKFYETGSCFDEVLTGFLGFKKRWPSKTHLHWRSLQQKRKTQLGPAPRQPA
jgi:hypothetical protein